MNGRLLWKMFFNKHNLAKMFRFKIFALFIFHGNIETHSWYFSFQIIGESGHKIIFLISFVILRGIPRIILAYWPVL